MKKNRTDLDKVTDGIYNKWYSDPGFCNNEELLRSIDASLIVISELLKYKKHELLEEYSKYISEEDEK
jgi:hypothetical protein